jgi:GntR family transcriptional regulator, histidine utilization repressor
MSGRWPPGHRLPFEIELADTYKVSRMTVNKVLSHMAVAGLIERRRKLGSFVAQPQSQAAILEIHDIEDEVRALGQDYSFALLRRSVREASDEDCRTFDIKRKPHVLTSETLHKAGRSPFCLEDRLINLDTVPDAVDANFSVIPPGTWLRHQVPWISAEHTIRAVSANAHLSRKLEIGKHAPCLVVQRRTWNVKGAVTFVKLIYPAERHEVVARFKPATGRSSS